MTELFWQASPAELKQGYRYDAAAGEFVCLMCGRAFADGEVFPHGGKFYEARKYVAVHIAENHRSPFHALLALDRKLTGLTEHQKGILELFYAGRSDNEIAKELGAGSTSTVRNHRFALRERQKQAKVFLAIMELVAERAPKKSSFIAIPAGTRNIDERFAITEEENTKILAACLPGGPDGPIGHFPAKEKKRVAVLRHVAKYFDPTARYTEKEANAVLKRFYDDYALLRRLLIDYGFLDRTIDGSAYWVKL
jgi:DNA-binding CsgD family transcriptional regulator